MKKGLWSLALTTFVLTVPGATPAEASPQERDFTWTGEVRPGRTLEVKGVNGAVFARASDDGRVTVEARKRARKSDPGEVRIEVVEHDGGVTLCAVYPTPRGKRPNVCAPGDEGRMNTRDNDVEVTFEVRVPAGVHFRGTTVNGDVETTELAGDAEVRTVNGNVRVRAGGVARASTVNGSIVAGMGRLDPDGPMRFSTVNGSIELDLPDDADAEVEARWVNGGLETDLPFTLHGKLSRHRAEGRLGDGGPRLELKTVNGSIRLY